MDQVVLSETYDLAKAKGFTVIMRDVFKQVRTEHKTPEGVGTGKYYSKPMWTKEEIVPTQTAIQKWLRDYHGMVVIADMYNVYTSNKYYYKMYNKSGNVYTTNSPFFKYYEDALEAGIIYALTNPQK